MIQNGREKGLEKSVVSDMPLVEEDDIDEEPRRK